MDSSDSQSLTAELRDGERVPGELLEDAVDFERHLEMLHGPLEGNMAPYEPSEAEAGTKISLLSASQANMPTGSLTPASKANHSPFRSLPQEMLQEIAILAIPSQPAIVTYESPLLLAHVCRSWRTAVFAYKALWKVLYFELDFASASPTKCKEVVETWFQRAGHFPLSFYLYSPTSTADMRGFFSPFLSDFIEPLRPLFHRIKHLGLGGRALGGLVSIFKNKAENLESLLLGDSDMSGLMDIDLLGAGYSGSPRTLFIHELQHLTLHDALGYFGPIKGIIPWNQLTSISMARYMETDEFCLILWACPRLRIGEFSIIDVDRSGASIPALEHFCLAELSLHLYDYMKLSDVFPGISLPHLVQLEVFHLGPGIEEGLERIIKQSMSPVERLAVYGNCEYVGAVQELTRYGDSVTDLFINLPLNPPIANIFTILSKTRVEVSGGYHREHLPKLANLWVDISTVEPPAHEMQATLAAIEEMVRSRVVMEGEPRQRLRTLTFSVGSSRMKEALSPILRPYVKLGLKFDICQGTPSWIRQKARDVLQEWEEGALGRRYRKRTL